MKYTELEQSIIELNELYREGKSPISDLTYDSLIKRLAKEQPDSDLLKKNILELGGKDKLPHPMPGLNKVHTLKEIKDWGIRNNIGQLDWLVFTPKADGAALLGTGKGVEVGNGDVKGWSRGDGLFGVDITNHYKATGQAEGNFGDYYLGEVIIPKSTFKKYKDIWKQDNGEPYANARNAVSSFFRKFDLEKEKLKEVVFLRYSVVGEYSNYKYSSKEDQLIVCKGVNKLNLPWKKCRLIDLTETWLKETFEEWKNQLDYDIDGIVIDVNAFDLRKRLGYHSNGNPNYAVAYKEEGIEEQKQSTIREIRWQPSRYGKLTPVAGIDPIILEGAEVTSVTLYNAKYIINMGLAVGCEVIVKRAGMVNPKIVEVLNPDVIGEEVLIDSLKVKFDTDIFWGGEDDEKVDLYLKESKEQKIREIEHFFVTIGVEGFKAKTIESFYNKGYINIFQIIALIEKYSILKIQNKIEEFVKYYPIEGFGVNSWENLQTQLQDKLKGIKLAKLQAASNCFPGMAEKTLKAITFDTSADFLNKDSYYEEVKNKLLAIDGFGKITVEDYLYYLPEYEKFFYQLLKIYPDLSVKYPWTESMYNKLNQIFKGEVIVFSGFRDKILQEKVESMGGKITTSFSGTTTAVWTKDINSTSSKVINAKNAGIRVESLEAVLDTYISLRE